MTTTGPYTLERLIEDLDRITREETDARSIAERAVPLVGALARAPGAIPAPFRRRPPGGGRGRYMLHRAPRFNVTAVVWGPGDTAGAHDHRTWGVIGVLENEIEETRYRVHEGPGPGAPARLEVRSVTRHGPGAVSSLVPGDEVHRMHNPTARDTVEVHVYGRDLTGLPRTTWRDDGTPAPLVSSPYLNC